MRQRQAVQGIKAQHKADEEKKKQETEKLRESAHVEQQKWSKVLDEDMYVTMRSPSPFLWLLISSLKYQLLTRYCRMDGDLNKPGALTKLISAAKFKWQEAKNKSGTLTPAKKRKVSDGVVYDVVLVYVCRYVRRRLTQTYRLTI